MGENGVLWVSSAVNFPVVCSPSLPYPVHDLLAGPEYCIKILLYDSNRAVWSEGARVAPERPRAGRWVEGGRHAVGQAARGRSRGQRAALEGRAQTCCTCTCTCSWVQRVLVVRNAWRAVRCGSKAMPPVGDTDGAGGAKPSPTLAPWASTPLPLVLSLLSLFAVSRQFSQRPTCATSCPANSSASGAAQNSA